MFPECQYQDGLPVYLKILYRASGNTVVQKQKDARIFCNC